METMHLKTAVLLLGAGVSILMARPATAQSTDTGKKVPKPIPTARTVTPRSSMSSDSVHHANTGASGGTGIGASAKGAATASQSKGVGATHTMHKPANIPSKHPGTPKPTLRSADSVHKDNVNAGGGTGIGSSQKKDTTKRGGGH
jgi:hypothetical protein